MTYIDDPDFRQIRIEFLEHIRLFHRAQSYTSDWRELCEELGICITPGRMNHHTTFRGQPFITFDTTEAKNRQDFTGLHELSHHLFKTAEAGFRALLEDKYSDGIAKDIEEELCNEAAGILLVPDPILSAKMSEHGYNPEVVFDLSARMGSMAACLTRLIQTHDIEAWGLIMRQDGVVEFSVTNTPFTLWKNHCIEAGHAIHQAWYGPLEQYAPVPYSSGSRKVKCRMRASANDQRVVALFAREFPSISDERQLSLFA